MKTLLTILAAACLSLTAQAQDYMLRLTLKEGQHFAINSDINMDMSVTFMGQDMKVNNKISFYYSEVVKSVTADGTYKMEMTFSRISMQFLGTGSDISYDTDISGEKVSGSNSLASAIQPLINRKFYAMVSASGKVESVEGLKELLDTVSADMTPSSALLLKSIASDEKMKASLQTSYGYLPDHKVRIGDSWKQNVKMDITIPVSTDLVYTLKEVKGNTATIGIVADSHTKDDNFEFSGVPMKLDITTQMNGEGQLDITTGLYSKTKMNVDMKGSVDALGSAMPISATGISQSTIKSVK